MKRNKLFIAGLVTVFVALCSLTLVSSTWAKYTSTATGEDSAKVAKWAWAFNATDIDLKDSKKVTFNLFNTINEADTTTAENDIAATDGSIIAPGTGGSFTFTITNKSEVTGQYALSFTIDNGSNIPVEFKLGNDGEWSEDITDLNVTASDTTKVAINGSTENITVYWRWAFAGDDAVDTALGLKGTDTVKVTLSITMTQVD